MRTCTVLDLEYTTWEGAQARGWSGENEHREIVQIGAVKADADTLEEVASLNLLVHPLINPELSAYFTELTGITQNALDASGVAFTEALSQLVDFIGDDDIYFWGPDEKVLGNEVLDVDALLETCTIQNVPFPFSREKFINMRPRFKEKGIDTSVYGSGTILNAFGAAPPDRSHNAESDARSVLTAIRYL